MEAFSRNTIWPLKTRVDQIIDFGRGGNAIQFQMHGWYDAESSHTWTSGTESALIIDAPEAPLGYFLELGILPLIVSPNPASQPLTISVGGIRIKSMDIRRPGLVAIRCPPPAAGQRRMTITFEHLGAARPCDVTNSQDARQLALFFNRIRILPILTEEPFLRRRLAPISLASHDLPTAGLRAADAAGVNLNDFLSSFETLAGNCDLGLVQRAFDVEPLSLLRFAGAESHIAVRALDTGFVGIGEDIRAVILPNNPNEWMIDDGYGLCYHTSRSPTEISADAMVAAERKKIAFLRRKILEDLQSPPAKIFVFSEPDGRSLEAALPLYLALRRQGEHPLVWVRPTTHPSCNGAVEEIMPGFYHAQIDWYALPMHGRLSIGGWFDVMVNTWLLQHQIADNPMNQ